MNIDKILKAKGVANFPKGTVETSVVEKLTIKDIVDKVADDFRNEIASKLAKRAGKPVGPMETLIQERWIMVEQVDLSEKMLKEMRQHAKEMASNKETDLNPYQIKDIAKKINDLQEKIVEQGGSLSDVRMLVYRQWELSEHARSWFGLAREEEHLKQLLSLLFTKGSTINKQLCSPHAVGTPYLFFLTEARMSERRVENGDKDSAVRRGFTDEDRVNSETVWLLNQYSAEGTRTRMLKAEGTNVVQISEQTDKDYDAVALSTARAVYSPTEELEFGLDGETILHPAYYDIPSKKDPFPWAEALANNPRFFPMIKSNHEHIRQVVMKILDHPGFMEGLASVGNQDAGDARATLEMICSKRENFLSYIFELAKKPRREALEASFIDASISGLLTGLLEQLTGKRHRHN